MKLRSQDNKCYGFKRDLSKSLRSNLRCVSYVHTVDTVAVAHKALFSVLLYVILNVSSKNQQLAKSKIITGLYCSANCRSFFVYS